MIKLKNGTTISKRVDYPKGDAKNPMSLDDVSTKYRDCASLVLSKKKVEASLEMVSNMESTPDMAALMDILVSKPRKA